MNREDFPILTDDLIYFDNGATTLKPISVIESNIEPNYVDFNKIKMDIRDKVGKYLYEETECKPMILIVVQEV